MLTGYMQKNFGFKSVGLCHSVQVCAERLLDSLQMSEHKDTCITEIAGINHQAWLLSIKDKNGNDLYPEIKRRSLDPKYADGLQWDLVRHDMMHRFGYYNTESSEHTSEYNPYYIKRHYPELIDRFKIPLDEYPRRCEYLIEEWGRRRELVLASDIEHEKSREFAAPIINAVVNGVPYEMHGNVLNKGLITNLPYNACVEVKCLVDRNGVNPCYVGEIPEQLAALNRTNINVQNLVQEAAKKRSKELVYMSAYLDPHTAAELSLDDIKSLCDDLFEAHGKWIPEYK
jgi:alpha-galactosidase